MAQLPNVKLKVHPSTFDRLMAVLEDNAASAADERDRMDARDLMEKRMRFSRLYPGRDGQPICSNENGYFYAARQSEIRATVAQLTGRISKITAAKNGLLKFYEEKEG